MELKGRTAVVTGAANGIGLALCELFLEHGMDVVMADIEVAALKSAAENLSTAGNVLAVQTDVSDAASVANLADRAYEKFGAVNILCSNAGVFTAGASWECSDADYRWVLDVNVRGVANCIRSFIPRMIAAEEPGHIINTASMASLTTMPFTSVYCLSKAAVLSLSECLHKELEIAAPQLKVSVLCPELVNTGIANAARNRPEEDQTPKNGANSDFAKLALDAIAQGTAQGLSPRTIAERVLQGIRDQKFYLLAEGEWKDAAVLRHGEISNETNPTLAAIEF